MITAIQSPEIASRMATLGIEYRPWSPAEFNAFVARRECGVAAADPRVGHPAGRMRRCLAVVRCCGAARPWPKAVPAHPPATHDTPFLYDRQAGFGATSSALGRGFTQDMQAALHRALRRRAGCRCASKRRWSMPGWPMAAAPGIGPDADSGGGAARRPASAADWRRATCLVPPLRPGACQMPAVCALQGLLDLSVPTGTADSGGGALHRLAGHLGHLAEQPSALGPGRAGPAILELRRRWPTRRGSI